ncbi:MAG TPA: CorA family divalent cation transporter [Candidatus Limnocylindrales bacterium]
MTIRAVLYDATGEDRELELVAGKSPKLGDKQLLWIDLDGRRPEDLRVVAATIGLEPEALDRLAGQDGRAKLLRLPDRVVLTIGAVDPDDEEVRRREVDILVGPNHVLTVHDQPIASLEDYRDEIQRERDLGMLDAVGFTAGLLDAILAAYFRQIESIEEAIDRLDEVAVRSRRDDAFLGSVLALRRRIARLRRALAPNREALLPLERPDFELRSDLGSLWPGIIQRLERAIDGVENARELLVGSFDLYLGRASQRTNDTMKVLTLISAVALPGVVLAGVMGMNFKLAFFDESANFFVVLAVMLAFAALILVVARWRRWI